MALKRHHKILIGSFSSVVVISLIVMGILLNGLIVKQGIDYANLDNKVGELRADTQNKINELTESIIETRSTLEENQQELDFLKASAGEDFSGIVGKATKSVVTVRTDVAQGTGFIIEDSGYIVTNAHVLSGGQELNIITSEQEIIDAELIGYDIDLDLALLKSEGNFDSLEFGDSDKIHVGEKVIAIGNPLGLQFSVSQGIVSAVHRPGPTGLEAYIQTDAALNPGNSGGPLIDKNGKVIGINNFKINSGESLGFALESNYIVQEVNQISQEELNQTLIG